VSEGADDAVPPVIPSGPSEEMSPEEMARLLMASGMPLPVMGAANKSALRRKLLVAVLIAAVGVGASIMSCVGQSFSLRQARAQEGIEQQLKEIRASCAVTPKGENAR
jgi:hypothetical protein